MTIMKVLNKVHQDKLASLPETGMGYQIVDMTMADGTVHKNIEVINGQYYYYKDIDPNDIKDLTIKKL